MIEAMILKQAFVCKIRSDSIVFPRDFLPQVMVLRCPHLQDEHDVLPLCRHHETMDMSQELLFVNGPPRDRGAWSHVFAPVGPYHVDVLRAKWSTRMRRPFVSINCVRVLCVSSSLTATLHSVGSRSVQPAPERSHDHETIQARVTRRDQILGFGLS